ncbi:hypothetical protein [Tomitella gaofuii]|uniref:hypothetical protein n=1 Tax=Tomitella gaofuii TaxID=2760083 RepID=UPI0015FCAE32|nr:hypothetical protein [Tomitella gaofuii]
MSEQPGTSSRPVTVAELLARNASGSGGSSDGGRSRRHHRGERAGGISVAELTGEIPVIREPVAEDRVDREREDAQDDRQDARDAESAAKADVNAAESEVPAEEDGAAEPAPDGEADGAEADGAEADGAEADAGAEPDAEAEHDAEAVADAHVDSDDSEPVGDADYDAEPDVDTDDDAEPVDDAEFGEAADADADEESAGVASVQESEPDTVPDSAPDLEPWAGGAPEPAGGTPTVAEMLARSDAPVEAIGGEPGATATAVIPVAEPAAEDAVADPAVAQDADVAAPETDDTDAAEQGGNRGAVRQWAGLALQVIVGVAVGAAVFKGFEKLWDSLPYVALVLSVLVILGLVAVVRILRKTDDIISLLLAMVVGVVVTLGPLAFVLSTQ